MTAIAAAILSLDSLTDGLPSNLLAEAIGITGGLLVTYLIVEKVVKTRLKRDRKPLRERLIKELGVAVQFLTVAWSIRLYVITNEEIKSGKRYGLLVRLEERINNLDPISLTTELRKYTGDDAIRRLAIETITYLNRFSRVADRAFQIIDDEPQIQSSIAGVESAGFEVEQALLGSYNSRMRPDDVAVVELGLATLTQAAFTELIRLWRTTGDQSSANI